MRQSESIQKLATALLLFQVKIDKISKDAVNPFFNSHYASLNNILDTIKEPLIESGLVIVQLPCGDNGLTTMLIHSESGEYIATDYFMKPEKVTPQSQGSIVSYQRRYCIQSLLMLSFEEDDDANLATHGSKAPTQSRSTRCTEQDLARRQHEVPREISRGVGRGS